MPTVQHFEIAADKIKRAQEFYNKFWIELQRIPNSVLPELNYWVF